MEKADTDGNGNGHGHGRGHGHGHVRASVGTALSMRASIGNHVGLGYQEEEAERRSL